MQKTHLSILLILLLFTTAAITACYRLSAIGFIVILILLAIIMYILSPYIKKISEQIRLYNSSTGGGNTSSAKSQGNKTANEKIHVSSYGPSLIELRLGKGLEQYASGYYDGSIPVLTAKLRNKLKSRYNYELPPVGIIYDNLLQDNDYKIRIRGYEIAYKTVSFSNSESPMEELILTLEQCVLQNLDKLKQA